MMLLAKLPKIFPVKIHKQPEPCEEEAIRFVKYLKNCGNFFVEKRSNPMVFAKENCENMLHYYKKSCTMTLIGYSDNKIVTFLKRGN